MDKADLVTLTADIVAAHVSNNSVAISDMGTLVQRVHAALSGLDAPAEAADQPKVPVVSVRASVKPDYLVCMECGKKQKVLKRHLQTAHEMTPQQYRSDYGLPADYPMTAPSYSQRRGDLARSLGLGRKKAEAAPDAAKAAAMPAARRPRSKKVAPSGE